MLKTSFKTCVCKRGAKQWLFMLSVGVIMLFISSPTWAQSKPQLIPNSRKYQDKGLKPATGRSGTVSMTARALLGKDGKSDVEMTTGELDSQAQAVGNINKAQLKPLDENGEALYARNYMGLSAGGYFKVTVDDLFRGQQVRVQNNISGIDGDRTAVVTVVETVKLRPDIWPSNINAPERGMVNQPVNISATVRELNGEVGAKVNLVLYVEGVEVDRAEGVWIDAGGTVSCAFTHKFSSIGKQQFEVRAEGTKPGDYDNSNNITFGSIDIIQPDGKLNYSVQVFDMEYFSRGRFRQTRFHNGVLEYRREEMSRQMGWRQTAHFYGWAPTAVSFPVSIERSETNDGAMIAGDSLAALQPDWSYEGTDGGYHHVIKNVWRHDAATGYYFNLYSTSQTDIVKGKRTELTYFSSTREAGDITYFSAGHERFWDQYGGNDFFYSWNEVRVEEFGTRLPMGTEYGINIALTSGDDIIYKASPKVRLTPFDNTGHQPFTCFDWAQDGYTGEQCSEGDYSQTGKAGYTALSVILD